MPVNLVSQPNGIVSLAKGVKYVFEVTNGGNDQEFLIYQIFRGDTNEEISSIEVSDTNGFNVAIDIARELRGYIDSAYTAPFIGSSVSNENKIIKEFYIRYGTVTVNEVDGECEVIQELDNDSDIIKVIRSTPQYTDAFDYNTEAILSKRPKRYAINKDAEDYITVLSGGSGNVNYTAYDINGNEEVNVGSLSFDVNLIALSPAALGYPAWTTDAVRIKAQIVTGGIDKTYNIILKDCCLGVDHVEVHFLEPQGSWSTVTFECQRGSAEVTYEGGLVCSGVSSADEVLGLSETLEMRGAAYGIINKKSNLILSLVRKMTGRVEAMKWHAAILSARKAFVYVLDTEGQRLRVNLLLSSGSATVIERGNTFDLIVSGQIILDNE